MKPRKRHVSPVLALVAIVVVVLIAVVVFFQVTRAPKKTELPAVIPGMGGGIPREELERLKEQLKGLSREERARRIREFTIEMRRQQTPPTQPTTPPAPVPR